MAKLLVLIFTLFASPGYGGFFLNCHRLFYKGNLTPAVSDRGRELLMDLYHTQEHCRPVSQLTGPLQELERLEANLLVEISNKSRTVQLKPRGAHWVRQYQAQEATALLHNSTVLWLFEQAAQGYFWMLELKPGTLRTAYIKRLLKELEAEGLFEEDPSMMVSLTAKGRDIWNLWQEQVKTARSAP